MFFCTFGIIWIHIQSQHLCALTLGMSTGHGAKFTRVCINKTQTLIEDYIGLAKGVLGICAYQSGLLTDKMKLTHDFLQDFSRKWSKWTSCSCNETYTDMRHSTMRVRIGVPMSVLIITDLKFISILFFGQKQINLIKERTQLNRKVIF